MEDITINSVMTKKCYLMQSKVIENILSEDQKVNIITLPNVEPGVLNIVLQCLNGEITDFSFNKNWTLFSKVFLMSDYLQIDTLFDTLSKYLHSIITNRTGTQIEDLFNIKGQLSQSTVNFMKKNIIMKASI